MLVFPSSRPLELAETQLIRTNSGTTCVYTTLRTEVTTQARASQKQVEGAGPTRCQGARPQTNPRSNARIYFILVTPVEPRANPTRTKTYAPASPNGKHFCRLSSLLHLSQGSKGMAGDQTDRGPTK